MQRLAFREVATSTTALLLGTDRLLAAVGVSAIFAIVAAIAVMRRSNPMERCSRWFRAKSGSGAANEAEARFRALAEAIPQIVWTAIPSSGVDYCNQRWCDLTGLTVEDSLGWGWQKAIHPDDLPVTLQNWERSRQQGVVLDMEYRLLDRSGGYRWHLVRATPMRDASGKIIRWFGACADIDDQMHTQQHLEEQIKEHTAALMAANSRLESEMRERALAQQQLDEQNERMVEELTLRSQRATTLAKMAELLQSCAELKDVFSVISGMAPKIFPELRGAVLLLDSSRQTLELAERWSDCELPSAVCTPQDCWALRTGHLHFVGAGDRTAPCPHVQEGEFSYVCIPLLSQGQSIGILHFQTRQSGELPESELSFASTFAEQVGLSIANIRLREALRNQSIRDSLTGLYNRRYLEETLERETRRAVRAEHGLGLLMLDLDHFKQFNDRYGHEAGDAVLRETTSFLVKSVRTEDIVCRFGGEEFVIILPMADLDTSQARAERIRGKIRELTVLHQGQTLGTITVSIGVAELPQHGTSPRELLDRADAALYRAKNQGRDRVAVANLSSAIENETSPEKASAQPVAGRG
jgi:diguanylate cyclase (GGDEF)-like protein/PAS domain S-box-containing protein